MILIATKSKRIYFSPHPNVDPIWLSALEKNETNLYLKMAICPPKKLIEFNHYVGYNNVLLVGLQGAGKTSKINNIIDIARRTYPREDLNILFTNSMQFNIDNLEDVFYNLLIVDDAVELQDSYQAIGKKAITLSHDFFDIRHKVEDRFNREVGYIVTVYATQLYKGLAKRLRQAPISIYTSVFNDKEENKFLRETLGFHYFYWLSRKHDFTYIWNRVDANAFCVVKLNADIRFGHFDKPISNMKKRDVSKKREKKDPELEALKPLILNERLPRAKIYEIFRFLHSKEWYRPQVKDPEPEYIRTLYRAGIKTPLLSQIFHRATRTVAKYIKEVPQKVKSKGTDIINNNEKNSPSPPINEL